MASPARDGDPTSSSSTLRSPEELPRHHSSPELLTSSLSKRQTRTAAANLAARGAVPSSDKQKNQTLKTVETKGRASKNISAEKILKPSFVSEPKNTPTPAEKIPEASTQAAKQSRTVDDMSLDVINLATDGLRLVDPLKGNITSRTRETLMTIFADIIEMATSLSKKTHQQETAFLKEKIALLQRSSATATASSGQSSISYASIAATGPSHAVIVSATDKTKTTSDIKKTLRQEVKPSSLKVGVSALIAAKDNKVIIKCPTHNDANKIRAALPGLTKGNLTAKEGKRLSPSVILKGIEKDTADEEIVEYILQQNDSIFEAVGSNKDAIKLQRTSQNKKRTTLRNAVLLVSNDVREAMLRQERISIGFQRVHVEDSCPLLQCFKCMGFGHTAARCVEKKDRCLHCAGEHKSMACTLKDSSEAHRCWNCHKMAKGKAVEAHRANSKTCPFRAKMLQRTMERMDY
jgi:hypothetical protein